MPIVGHALAGWATASVAQPPPRPGGRALWLPVLVVLAYLPDIASQVAQLAGVSAPTLATHSVLVALAVTPVLALAVHRGLGVPWRLSLGVVGVSLVLHDLLDLLNSPQRSLLWPLSSRPTLPGPPLLDLGPAAELFAFGAAAAIVALVSRLASGRRTPGTGASGPTRAVGWGLVAGVLLAALGTAHLRQVREEQIEEVKRRLADGDHAGALTSLAAARRWPSTADPGRADYLAAEARLGLGDRAGAEHLYLESYRADPSYFWVVADLAVFYAMAPKPGDEREKDARSFLDRLRTDFPDHEAQPRMVARVERALHRE